MRQRHFDPFPQNQDPVREECYMEIEEIRTRLKWIEDQLADGFPDFKEIASDFQSISSIAEMLARSALEVSGVI